MIQYSIDRNSIRVTGHANQAPKGYGIVCAGVSAVTQTLLKGLQQVTGDCIDYSIEPGNVAIRWQTLSDRGKALIDTWFIGMTLISNEYPEYVQIAP